MKAISKKTKSPRKELQEKAKSFLSEKWGLKLDIDDDCCLKFSSDLGFVTVQMIDTDDDKIEVELITREYEYQIQEYLRMI
jgi:hypothetical protein